MNKFFNDNRVFGLIMGIILVGIGANFHLLSTPFWIQVDLTNTPLFWCGILVLSIGLIAPKILKPITFIWIKIGHILGYINTRLIMGVCYFVILTPIGFCIRLFGHDPLHRKIDHKIKSYWIKRDPPMASPMNHQF